MPGLMIYLRRISSTVMDVLKDPFWNLVSISARSATGVTAGTGTFVDSSTNNAVITKGGDVVQKLAAPFAGVGSAYFDGSGDYLTYPNSAAQALGNDFTIEFWINAPLGLSNKFIFGARGASGGNIHITVGGYAPTTAGTLRWGGTNVGTTRVICDNTWHHCAITRQSGTVKMWIDGVMDTSLNDAAASTGTTGTFIIGANDHASAFGTADFFNGYLSNFRVVPNVAIYTANFTPPTTALTAVSGTSLLLNFANGLAQNQETVDTSPNRFPVTTVGGPSGASQGPVIPLNSTLSGSARFNGATDYYTVPSSTSFDFGTGDFTVELWANFSALTSNRVLVDRWISGDNGSWQLYWRSTGSSLVLYAGSAIVLQDANAATIRTNCWHHIAVCRVGSVVTLYVDGVQRATASGFTTNLTTTRPVAIGVQLSTVTNPFSGYISNVRIVKGTAVYTTNFTPPTADLTSIPGTSLLLTFGSAAIIDKSATNNAITVGNASTNTTKKLSNNSLYFNGTTDYIQYPDFNTATFFNSNTYTSDGWFYSTNNAATKSLFGTYPGAGVANGTGMSLEWYGTNKLAFFSYAYNSGGAPIVQTTSSIPTNTWNHFALVKIGTAHYLYLNGVLEATGTASYTVASGGVMFLGNCLYSTGVRGWAGYLDDIRFTPGVARYTSNFSDTLSSSEDPYWNNVVFLLAAEGTNGSAVFTDEKGHTISRAPSNLTTLTTSVKKFGVSSVDNTSVAGNTYLVTQSSPDFILSGEFTVEFWVSLSATSNSWNTMISVGSYADGILVRNNGSDQFYINGTYIASGNQFITDNNVWHHIAVTRDAANMCRIFVDGVLKGSATRTGNINGAGAPIYIGCSSHSFSERLTGWIDDVRITKGVARYTSNFTVPTTASPGSVFAAIDYSPTSLQTTGGDPYYNQTVLHLHMNGIDGGTTFIDQKRLPITVDNVVTKTGTKKFGTASAYFTGSDRLFYSNPQTTSEFSFPGDFTFEGWINFTNVTYGAGGYSPDNNYIFDIGVNGCIFRYYAGNWRFEGPMAGTVILSYAHQPALNTWYHWAITRQNGIVRMFINGTLVASVAYSATYGSLSSFNLGDYGGDGPYGIQGYMDEVRVTKGVARYTSSFAVPTEAFPDYQDFLNDQYLNQSIIIKTDKLGDNNTFVDSSTNNLAITRVGNVTQGSFTPFNTAWSGHFDGAGDYLTIPSNAAFSFGTGDFTIEAWVNPAAAIGGGINNDRTIFGGVATNPCIYFFLDNANNAPALWDGTSTNTATSGIPANTWTHVAVSRASGTLRIFINGAVAKSVTGNTVNHVTNSYLTVGGTASSNRYMNGYISNLRIVKGTALYTANFMPSTAPLTAVSGTSLLTCQSSRFVDNSANNVTLAVVGNASVQPFSPFASSGYSEAANGGSMYFDGVGDYTQVPASSALALGTLDFTVEAWVCRTAYNSNGTSGKYPRIINASDTWMTNSSWALTSGHYDWGQNKFGFHVYAQNGNTSQMLQSTTSIVVGNWYHVAITRSGSTFRMFVNGVQEATATWAGSMDTGSTNTARIGGAAYGAQDDFHNGYISNLRIVKGTALYTANFTPSTSPLTAVSGTSLLLNGTNANVYDASGKTVIETVGNTSVVNAGNYSKAVYFDGSGDYLTLPASPLFNFSSGDFTVEMWINLQSTARQWLIHDISTDFWFGIDYNGAGTNKMGMWASADGTSWTMLRGDTGAGVGTTTIPQNTWCHIAVVRCGDIWTMYVNGTLDKQATVSGSVFNRSATAKVIGRHSNGAYPVTGFIEDVRITKGVARYTGNFTVPLAPFPVTSA